MVDVRSKTVYDFLPLFDYTIGIDEAAEAHELITGHLSLNLKAFKQAAFTLDAVIRIADEGDATLAGLRTVKIELRIANGTGLARRSVSRDVNGCAGDGQSDVNQGSNAAPVRDENDADDCDAEYGSRREN